MSRCLVSGIGLEQPRRFPAIDAGQRQIHQDQIGHAALRLVDGFAAIARGFDAKAGKLEVVPIHLAGIVEIFDDQNQRLR